MTHSSEPAITILFDDEHEFRLPLGTQLSFGPDHWVDTQQTGLPDCYRIQRI